MPPELLAAYVAVPIWGLVALIAAYCGFKWWQTSR